MGCEYTPATTDLLNLQRVNIDQESGSLEF